MSVFRKFLDDQKAKDQKRYEELKAKKSVFAEFFNPNRSQQADQKMTPWGTPFSGSKKTKSPWAGF